MALATDRAAAAGDLAAALRALLHEPLDPRRDGLRSALGLLRVDIADQVRVAHRLLDRRRRDRDRLARALATRREAQLALREGARVGSVASARATRIRSCAVRPR